LRAGRASDGHMVRRVLRACASSRADRRSYVCLLMFSAIGGPGARLLVHCTSKASKLGGRIQYGRAGGLCCRFSATLGERSLRYDVPIFVPLRPSITDYALATPHSRIPECILDRTKRPLGIQWRDELCRDSNADRNFVIVIGYCTICPNSLTRSLRLLMYKLLHNGPTFRIPTYWYRTTRQT
jgi:hypothetical protein